MNTVTGGTLTFYCLLIETIDIVFIGPSSRLTCQTILTLDHENCLFEPWM